MFHESNKEDHDNALFSFWVVMSIQQNKNDLKRKKKSEKS